MKRNRPPLSSESLPPEAARQLSLAADPQTPPGTLQALFAGAHPRLQWALACNPSTPAGTLERLFIKHPLAVLENPLFSYRAFTEGKPLRHFLCMATQLALYGALRAAGRDGELEDILPAAVRCRWLGGGLPQTLSGSLDEAQLAALHGFLATDPSDKVREATVGRLPREFLAPLATDPSRAVRIKLAGLNAATRNSWARPGRDPAFADMLDDAIRETLSLDPAQEVRAALAGSLLLQPAVHERLAGDRSREVRIILASTVQWHPHIRESAWRTLAATSTEAALKVAGNPTYPGRLRLELTAHRDPAVRKEAWKSANLRAPGLEPLLLPAVRKVLARPARRAEAIALAGNPTIPEAAFNELCGAHPDVLHALAGNRCLARTLKQRLLLHPDEAIAERVLTAGGGCGEPLARAAAASGRKRLKLVLAKLGGRGPVQARAALAVDADPQVRMALAEDVTGRLQSYNGPNIRNLLGLFSRDPKAAIRRKAAADPRLPRDDVLAMCQDPDPQVRLLLIKRYYDTPRTDLGLLGDADWQVRQKAAERILKCYWNGDRALITGYAEKIAADPRPEIRAIAASSGRTPVPLLGTLADDPDPEVQRAISGRLLMRSLRPGEAAWAGVHQKRCGPVEALFRSPNPCLRARAAALTALGSRRLASLAADKHWLVRLAAVDNAKLDATLLARLAADPHPLVQAHAARQLKSSVKTPNPEKP